MERLEQTYDVVVVGGGPVGAVAAMSAARRGQSVLVLEANPRAAQRFAGEWLHPTGVAVLDRLRLGRLEQAQARVGYGFSVFPGDGRPPIELPYPQGQVALACEHAELVRALRARLQGYPEVCYLAHARALDLRDHEVRFRYRDQVRVVRAGRILGADGRSGLTRRTLGLSARGPALSYMASVELRGVTLPSEGYGHVLLGGPGPVLMYRIGPELVRGCFDVPLRYARGRRDPGFLWDAFSHVLPDALRESFCAALRGGPVRWATNRFAPRARYGEGALWLTGDAVGHYHPLTAAGLSMGFMDAERAGQATSLSEYAREREARSYVPELLSNALYHVFSRDDDSAAQIRASVYRVWRRSAFERRRTMRILMGDEDRRRSFGAAFVRIAADALGSTLVDLLAAGRLREVPEALSAYREWAQWPAASLAPAARRRSYRPESTSERPIPGARLPARPAAPLHAAQNDNGAVDLEAPARVLRRGGEVLLEELRGLLEEIGRSPEWQLARRAAPRMVAIDAADLGDAMAARMELGRRPLASRAFGALLQAYAADAAQVRCEDFAGLLLALYAGPTPPATVAGLAQGLQHLYRCQLPCGAFAVWPASSAEPDLATTSLACRALAAYRGHVDGEAAAAASGALERALGWLRRGQHADGHWSACDARGALSNSALALSAMLAAGAGRGDPAVKRAVLWLLGRQRTAGCFADDVREAGLEATARVVRALLEARAPAWDAVQQAAARLAARVEGALSAGGGCPPAVLEALALYQAHAEERPRVEARERAAAARAAHWDFCRASLEQVSRTFSKPIAMLPDELEVAVTCGYLLCRVADTVEDHPAVPQARKDALFARFLEVLECGAPPRHLSEEFADIAGDDPDDPELALARALPRVMQVFWSLPASTQGIVSRWVSEMARGMNVYTRRAPGEDGFVALHTVDDLTRYCYFVAGTVGHMLTELFTEALADDLGDEDRLALRSHAEGFGCGLQLVNILKDVTDDRQRRWSFVPRESCAAAGTDIAHLTDRDKRAQAHAAVAPLFDLARRQLDSALVYALTIPPQHRGVRLFCLLPLWMAALTLRHGRGNDAMFTEGAEVKISRAAVAEVIAQCSRHVADDDALRSHYRALWANHEGLQSRPQP